MSVTMGDSVFRPPIAAEFARVLFRGPDDMGLVKAINLVRARRPPVNDVFRVNRKSGEPVFIGSPLHFAVLLEKLPLARALIEEGADVNAYVELLKPLSMSQLAVFKLAFRLMPIPMLKLEHTPVRRAIAMDNPEMLAVLCDAGADLRRGLRDVGDSSSDENSALETAVAGAHMTCVTYLLDEARMDARSLHSEKSGFSPVLTLASMGNEALPVFKMLVAHGFDVSALSAPNTEALLGRAMQHEDKKLLRYFIKELGMSGDSIKIRQNAESDKQLSMTVDCMMDLLPAASTSEHRREFDNVGSKAAGQLAEKNVTCATCGIVASVYRCSRCSIVRYCSKTCQKNNWSAHKSDCKMD